MKKTIDCNNTYSQILKDSKFISYSFRVYDTKDVGAILDDLGERHPTATHICYAYSISGKNISSDDGEPSGTAGAPILSVITKRALDFTLVAVVRYFGGTKLGAGGLIRAYTASAARVLDLSGTKNIHLFKKYIVSSTLADSRSVSKVLSSTGIIQSVGYGDRVEYTYLSQNFDPQDILKFGAQVQYLEDVWQ